MMWFLFFTNIPFNEAMDTVCNCLHQQHLQSKYSKDTFKRLPQIATGWYVLYEVNYAVKLMV